MSVDSWAWDVEESTPDQDWNKCWPNAEFHHNQAKNVGGYTGAYGRSNNNGQSGAQPPRQRVSTHPQQPGPQPTAAHHPNSTADYFSAKTPLLPSINNNPYSEVENKEIAPPDHHPQLHGNRHAMKLGVKHQGQGRHDQSGHQGNIHQTRNPLPPLLPHPPDNHHQVQHSGDPVSRNVPHHSYTDNRKDFFQSDTAASLSYFDQASQQQNPPLQKLQPTSLPPEHQEPPPNNFFNDHHTPVPQQEPQNINYFQMQDKLGNFKNFNSSELPPPREPVDNHQSPKHEIPSHETPLPPDNLDNCPVENLNVPHEKEHNPDQNVNNFNMNQFDDRPSSFDQAENIQRGFTQPSVEAYNDKRLERFGPQGFEEKSDPAVSRSQEWNEVIMPPPSQPHLEMDRPEQISNRFSGSHHQAEGRAGPHERLGASYYQERPGSQGSAVERPTPRHGPPPQSQERPSSRDSHQALPPSAQGNQEWRGPHHKQQGDRANLQGRDWPGPFHSGSQEKLSHQRTASLGSDRSGSLGRDRSSSERSGPSREQHPHWTDPAAPHSEPSGPRNDQPLRRPDDSMPQSEASVTRPDRVPSRSPGAGEDRSPSTSRPDNLESLPPEFNITNQISQLSIHPKDKMGDCPLDRNEYLETSQLSNHEMLETEMRSSRQGSADTNSKSHRGERREVVGEAEPLTGRVVVGHTTPTTTPPPHNHHSDELEGGGSGSMERMVPGERREQGSRGNNSGSRSAWRRNQHRRESSYEDDEQDYLSDNRRTHRDDYRREERHRNDRGGQDHRSSDYMSDEEYEIDRRMYSRRDRRFRERDRDRDREKDYDQDYRRDYYRDDISRRSGRRGREYYRYDDDEYSYRERSRPSSRSESDYRRGNLDYQHRNPSRHYFNPSLAGALGGREYEANPEYFERMRKTNPVLYAIWYQDYMRKLQDTAAHSAFTQSDRASIHSGQSSGNRLHVSTPSQALDSNIGNVDSFDDYSPRLFSTPHVRGSYDSQGRLVLVNACNPLDGQSASVQVLSVDSVDEDPAVREFLDSPGPFIPGVTHRSSVLQYLRKMSEQAVKSSEKLLYDLVHLIVKSNGKPDAGDISELLLESYRLCKGESRDDWEPEDTTPVMCHQDMLTSFRNLLHQGNKQEALEWAMKNGGWGHALFLASKMDARTQARVAAEFARSLAASDPLSTLYQMMSGGVPAAATACSDRRWADWRPHLAMVLSNLTDKPAMDLATITTLADGLASRGRLHAAHSCYIIAQVMFGDLYRGEGPILLGCGDPQLNMASNQCRTSSSDFNYKSFLLTLCYEYAVKQGHPSFFIPALQRYKLLVAWRLVEWGRGRHALLYCELLGSELLGSRSQLTNNSDLVRLLVELSSSLKSLDPACAHATGDLTATPDPDWLAQLKQIETNLPQEEVEPIPVPVTQPIPDQSTYPNFEGQPHVPMYGGVGNMDGMYPNQTRLDEAPVLSLGESLDQPSSTSTPSKPNELHQVPHQMQQGVPPMQPPMQPASLPTMSPYSQPAFSQPPPGYPGYDESGKTEVDHSAEVGILKPSGHGPESEQLSLPSNKGTSFFHASENLLQDLGDASKAGVQKPSSAPAAVSEPLKKPDATNGSGGGWFGGILGKLSRKPKNEMILPDDKDPKIVFDSKKNKWVDRDNEGNEGARELKPPPTGSLLGMPPVSQSIPPNNSGMPSIPMTNPALAGHPPSGTTNMYKLQKGKSMKSNYVDILSNSGSSSKVTGGMDQFLPMAPHNNKPNYFVPQTVDGSQMHNDGSYQGQLSRSSSMSSLSREVQHYMDQPRSLHRPPSAPRHATKRTGQAIPTYNPANFKS